MKKNDWISEDIWVNYCFLPDNVVSLPNRNLRSKTLNVGSASLNGGSTTLNVGSASLNGGSTTLNVGSASLNGDFS